MSVTSVYSDSAKSPLENVWRRFFPEGHDQALRNAFYNVAAVVFVIGATAAAYSVYLIFQPFIQPLLWAVLCGSVIHPVKHTLTDSVRNWLTQVEDKGSLLTFSAAFLPISLLDDISERIGLFVMNHVKGVIGVTVVLPIIYIVFHHTPVPLTNFVCFTVSLLYFCITSLLEVIGYCRFVVLSLLLVLITSFFWSAETAAKMRKFSFLAWLLGAATIASFFQNLSFPVFAAFCLMFVGGLAVEVFEVHSRNNAAAEDGSSVSIMAALSEVLFGVAHLPQMKEESAEVSEETDKASSHDSLEEVPEEDSSSVSQDVIPEETEQTSVDDVSTGIHTPVTEALKPKTLLVPPEFKSQSQKSLAKEAKGKDKKKKKKRGGSSAYIKAVGLACILVEFWRHNYLLPLLPIAVVYYGIKKASQHIFGERIKRSQVQNYIENSRQHIAAWIEERKDVLFPLPVRGLSKLLRRIDRKLTKMLASSADAAVTLVLILVLILFFVFFTIFLAVQIQGESMHLIAIGSQVVNATIMNNPQFLKMLPEGLGDMMGSAMDNAYLYGREWIGRMVRNMLGETDDDRASALEKQVVELWDRIYQAWVVAQPQSPYPGPVVTSEAVAVTFDSLVEGLSKTPELISVTAISDVIRENLGTVMSVLESIWVILISNINLAMSALTATVSLLLGGSLSILNWLFNLIVFFSALFYLVSISSAAYKPVSILGNLAPTQMKGLGVAVEESINSVFKASFHMGVFYGMWTWLLHTLFGTKIVYIPSVLGALFGAVPLVGTYWAALPGAIELLWGHGSLTMAALLFGAQLLPLSFVDTAIYAEIEGGGHPYLTGLAVAGGIFYWGAQGAILGPLVLCILLVVTKMYSSFIQPPGDLTQRLARLRRLPTIM